MSPLLAFHGKDSIKKKYLDRVKKHYELDEITGCWVWNRGVSHSGYAVTWFKGKTCSAHRIFYQMYKGMIPEGFCILHSCDNKICVNPRHLSIGTMKDNIQDAVSKGRMAKGERQGSSLLTTDQVIEIKRSLKQGLRVVDIASNYNVDVTTLYKISNGINWRHI